MHKEFRAPHLTIALVLSLIHGVVINSLYYINSSVDNLTLINLALLSALSALVWMYGLSFSSITLYSITPIIFMVDGLAVYCVNKYRMFINADSLSFIYETNYNEAIGFVDYPLVLYVLLSGVLAVVTVALVKKYIISKQSTHLSINSYFVEAKSGVAKLVRITLLFLVLAVVHVLAGWGIHAYGAAPSPLPDAILSGTKKYIQEQSKIKELLKAKRDLSLVPATLSQHGITAVLVIGESARSDHFSINGYERNTNPMLQKIEVLSYTDVLSCANKTRISVPCLMTRNTVDDHNNLVAESSFVKIFSKLGFNTYWISNQRVMHENDTITTAIAQEANHVYFQRQGFKVAQDAILIPKIKTYLGDSGQDKLLVIHTIGSHRPYHTRYTSSARVFTPECLRNEILTCDVSNVINSYDNTIVATDAFLAELIRMLTDKNAFMLYVSDHGESLGEEGIFSHGQAGFITEQRKIPMIFWASPSYKKQYADKVDAAKAHLNQELSHDYVFHSIIDCAGVSSELVDEKLSLCSAL